MKIVVYGSGCKSCHMLHESVLKVVKDNAIDAEVIYENDLSIIVGKGIMQMPALEVDGKIICKGRIPKEKELLTFFS